MIKIDQNKIFNFFLLFMVWYLCFFLKLRLKLQTEKSKLDLFYNLIIQFCYIIEDNYF